MVILCALRAYHGPRGLTREADQRRKSRRLACKKIRANQKHFSRVLLQEIASTLISGDVTSVNTPIINMYTNDVHIRDAQFHVRKSVNIAKGVNTTLLVSFRLTLDNLSYNTQMHGKPLAITRRCFPCVTNPEAGRSNGAAFSPAHGAGHCILDPFKCSWYYWAKVVTAFNSNQ